MSHAEQYYLSGKKVEDKHGKSIDPRSLLPNETKLDFQLLNTPEKAADSLRYLLRHDTHRMSPYLSRLALKGISLPVFIREFQGENDSDENAEDIEYVAQRNAVLLQSYLELIDARGVDQAILNQAINDATVLQLANRTLGSLIPNSDDITLLPSKPAEQYATRPTQFMVFDHETPYHAHLIVIDIDHEKRPQPEFPDTIYIRPAELTGPKANMKRLAKVLIAEQQLETLEPVYEALIAHSTSYLHDKINSHFDRITQEK